MISRESLAYYAGLFDGEGTVGIRRSYRERTLKGGQKTVTHYELYISIANTNPVPLKELYELFGGYKQMVIDKRRVLIAKPLWRWQLTAKKAENFLKLIFPYLRIKTEEVETALEYRKIIKSGKGRKKLTRKDTKIREVYKETLQNLKQRRFYAM